MRTAAMTPITSSSSSDCSRSSSPGSGALSRLGFGIPAPTGKYDGLTGFYIYHTQGTAHTTRAGSGMIVDGCVSTARGSSFGPPRTLDHCRSEFRSPAPEPGRVRPADATPTLCHALLRAVPALLPTLGDGTNPSDPERPLQFLSLPPRKQEPAAVAEARRSSRSHPWRASVPGCHTLP